MGNKLAILPLESSSAIFLYLVLELHIVTNTLKLCASMIVAVLVRFLCIFL